MFYYLHFLQQVILYVHFKKKKYLNKKITQCTFNIYHSIFKHFFSIHTCIQTYIIYHLIIQPKLQLRWYHTLQVNLTCSFNFLILLAVCLNISTVINIKILTNSNQQTKSYKFTSHIAAFLSVVLITEMLEICIQTSYDQNVQLILKSYLPVVYGTPLNERILHISLFRTTENEGTQNA